jgi:hypothetical protein
LKVERSATSLRVIYSIGKCHIIIHYLGGDILSKKLIVGLILCFCFEASALAAAKCGNDEPKVMKSNTSRYEVDQCLSKKAPFHLETGECVVLQHHKKTLPKGCGEYSDESGIMGFIEKILKMVKLNSIKDSCDVLDMGKIQNLVFCIIKSPYRLFFYREDASFAGSFTIVDDRNNKSYTYHWQQGENTFPWPFDQLPIHKGTNYRIKTQAGNLWEYFSFRQKYAANSENYWILDWGCLPKVEGIEAEIGPIKSVPFN